MTIFNGKNKTKPTISNLCQNVIFTIFNNIFSVDKLTQNGRIPQIFTKRTI